MALWGPVWRLLIGEMQLANVGCIVLIDTVNRDCGNPAQMGLAFGPLAQVVEPRRHAPMVASASLARPTVRCRPR